METKVSKGSNASKWGFPVEVVHENEGLSMNVVHGTKGIPMNIKHEN